MIFIEFHDLNGNIVYTNFAAILFISKNPNAEGSIVHFTGGTVTEIKETVGDIQRMMTETAMRQAIGQRMPS